MKRKNLVALALCAVMMFALAACGGSSAPAATTAPAAATEAPAAAAAPAAEAPAAVETTVIKLGTTVNEQDSFQVAAEKFAELVYEGTNGAYTIEIHPNGELGGERDMLESMQMGTLDMGIITSGPFVNFCAEMGVLDMPYLFSSKEEVYAVLDGEVGQALLDELESAGLKGLAYAERGFRNLTNNVRPIETAADLEGLKIRIMENEVYTAAFNALNVNATPMAWADALTALQQGTVDGEENPINVINSYKLWESQKYCTLDGHSYSTAIITMSFELFETLDADTQKVFKEAAQAAAEHERQWVADKESDMLQAMKDNGMEVVENPDLTSFKEAVQPVYEQFTQYADVVAQINAVIAAMK